MMFTWIFQYRKYPMLLRALAAPLTILWQRSQIVAVLLSMAEPIAKYFVSCNFIFKFIESFFEINTY
jgi:hypothetical protein